MRRSSLLHEGGSVARAAAAALAGALVLGAGATARAQSATALERFQPAPAGDALFASPSAGVDAHQALDVALAFSFAHAPLALRTQDAATGETRDVGAIVGHQGVLHLMVAGSLFSRVKVELDAPMTLTQEGDSPAAGGVTAASPSGFAMNDVRVGLRVTALEANGYWPGAALAMSAWLPSGDAEAYTGTGSARFEPRLILGADYGRVVWSASVGRQLGDPGLGLLGSEVAFSAGIAARIDRFQIGPEVFGSVLVDRPEGEGAAAGGLTPSSRAGGGLEALLGAKGQLGPVQVGLAAGLGFLRSAGTPDFRVVGGITYRPVEVKKAPPGWSMFGEDAKGEPAKGAGAGAIAGAGADGAKVGAGGATVGAGGATVAVIPGAIEAADTDGDGVPDAADGCPKIVGDARPEAKRPGCPADADGDGIWDAEDRCPERAGVIAEGAKNGCPADTDGDGLVDPDDACPAESGPKTADPKTTGCPASVRVVGSQIVILQQVNFETAKARILPSSFDLLQQVADVLAQHKEIARLAVDGHTDDRGTEASNLELSRARAVSVMRWLTEKGVDPRRLEARGFGPRRPVADNTTNEGRAKNRRVEFQIRSRTTLGEAGWTDGPVE